MKKPTIFAAWAWLAVASGPLVAAPAATEPYRLAAPGGWISVARDLPITGAKPVEEGESDYLLVDNQVRLAAAIAICALLAVYVLRSQRVRATFVNPLPKAQ